MPRPSKPKTPKMYHGGGNNQKKMKRTTLITIILLLLSFDANCQKKTHIIGFYNLENLFDTYDDPIKNDNEFLPDGANQWTEVKYRKKLHNMATVIAAMANANGRFHTILGVSEIENRLVLEDLVQQPEIAKANFQIEHFDSPDRRGVDVALLYRPDQFNLIASESIPFDFNSDIPFLLDDAGKDYFRTRDVLMARGTIDDEMFAFFVCHLPSRAGGKDGDNGATLRDRGAEIIYNRAMELQKEFPGIKIVVMGDMNDNPTDTSMELYLHGKPGIAEMGPEDFFCPFTTMLKAGLGSLAYQGEWSIYDIIMMNESLARNVPGTFHVRQVGKKGYYGVIFKEPFMLTKSGQYKGYPFRTFSNGSFIGGYSDHLPTYIVIEK